MADAFDDQRLRDHIEALVHAICAIRGCGAPNDQEVKAFVQREATRHADAAAAMHDPDLIARLVEVIQHCRIRRDGTIDTRDD